MKRILWFGTAIAWGVMLAGCVADENMRNHPASSPVVSSPADSQAQSVGGSQIQRDIAGVKVLLVFGCSEKLNRSSLDRPDDLAEVTQCVNDQMQVIGNETLSRLDANVLREGDSGRFMLDQAADFLQANSEQARNRDRAELIQIAVKGGSGLLISPP